MDNDWEVIMAFENAVNREVVNDFLHSLKLANRSTRTIDEYRLFLQKFFGEQKKEFSSLSSEIIHEWFRERFNGAKEKTLRCKLSILSSFYTFCVAKEFIHQSPIYDKGKKDNTDIYWRIKRTLPNIENQNVVNAYLLCMKNVGRSRRKIIYDGRVLQSFFKDKKISFSGITAEDIQKWFDEHERKWCEGTRKCYLVTLRSFCAFCVQEGYMEKSPLKKTRWVLYAEKYWEIQQPFANQQNKNIVNQFLLHLKSENHSKRVIGENRVALQSFFRRMKKSYTIITPKDIQQWVDEYQENLKRHTIINNLSYLRSFYRHCIKQGLITESPVLYQWERDASQEKDWVLKGQLPNPKNQEVIHEFLLSMKLENLSKATIDKYRYFLWKFFCEREELFSSLTPDIIQKWLIDQQKDLKERTITKYLGMLSMFYRFCIEEGYMEKSPIKSRWYPRLPKPVPKYLEKEDITKLRIQSEKEKLRDQVIVEFLLVTGCRIGEIHGLDRTNVNLENRSARVRGKGRKIRTVHFREKCALLLERYLKSRNDDHPALFVSAWGTRLGRRQLYTIIEAMGNKAGLSVHLHPHRLRHTFATELLAKGADLSFIADEMGHKDIQTTLTYAQLLDQKLISMYRKFMG